MLRLGLLIAVVCITAFPAASLPLVYASNERGLVGVALGAGSVEATERYAMEYCGGAAQGCKIVMSVDSDCMAFAESNTEAGYWYYVAASSADAYDRNGALRRIRDTVMGWCNDGDAPGGTCRIVHMACADYIQQIN